MARQAQRLHRSRDSRLLFGVAGGLAEYFDVDPVLIRMGWILLTVATVGIALLFYIVLAIITPKNRQPASGVVSGEDDMDEEPTNRNMASRNVARNALGIGLVVVGAIILLHQLEVIGAIRWDIVWPVGIVVLGIIILRPNIAALHSRLPVSRTRPVDDSSGESSSIESRR
ncbi:MAG: PspC domain-containing protein [Dehalococcoidia bacterium]|nr:PspC domain-containing protein [Dehalococcoidia bacterium]